MIEFKISKQLGLPRDSVTWVFAFLAKRGAGKTYDAADLNEEMLKAGIPTVTVDGMGIWWGLRVGTDKDGNPDAERPGLPVVVFGGKHADLPLVPEKAEAIAKAVVEANISIVLDVSEFSKTIMRRIVTNFLDALYSKNTVERMVFIEEADMFAPQKTIGPEQAVCKDALSNFVRRGGNHNLGCTLITQRSAVLDKDLLTQADCLVILRTLAPQDKKAIQAWVEEQTDKERRELDKWYDSLKSLQNGEAYVWHPEDPAIFQKVMFRKRETFHATRKFLLSKEAPKVELMPVPEFIERFRDKFEPKPKPLPSHSLDLFKVGIVPEHAAPATQRLAEFVRAPAIPPTQERPRTFAEIPMQPLRTAPLIPEPVRIVEAPATVQQSYPTLQIQRELATLAIPLSLQQPQTPLGRLAVALSTTPGPGKRDDAWTIKAMKEAVSNHGWPEDGIDQAIQQFVQWDLIRKMPSKAFKFFRDRVQVVDVPVTVNPE